jgi:predicted MFS family arabinose efflux permease
MSPEPQLTPATRERVYVFILAAIQVAHILDFVIMMPLGPRFMEVFRITPVEFSTLVAAYTFSAGTVGLFGAVYADQFDRKKFLLFNFTGFILGTLLCALAPGFSALLIGRIIAGGFGGVLNASVHSLVADLIPFERRGAALGIVMSAFSISSIAGVPLGLYIANLFDWHAAFYFICVLGLLCWGAAWYTLPSVPVAALKKNLRGNLKNFRDIVVQKNYLEAFALTSTLGFGIFMIIPFIAPYFVKNVGIQETDLPLIYLVGGLFTIVTARLVGKLSDRKGSFTVFRALVLLSVFPILALTNLPPMALLPALVVSTAFTMFGSARFIPAMTMVSAVVKPTDRGTFMSLENAARQFACGLGSQAAGLIVGSTAAGSLTNFNVAGAVCIVSSLSAIGLAFRIKRKYNLR